MERCEDYGLQRETARQNKTGIERASNHWPTGTNMTPRLIADANARSQESFVIPYSGRQMYRRLCK